MSTSTRDSLSSSSVEANKAFSDHLAELRSRLFWIVVAFILTSALAYNFREIIIDVIMNPLGEQSLVYLTPGGGFSFIFQITMYVGAVVTAPLIVFHLYRFVKPALPIRAQRYSFRMMMASLLLMVGGVLFGYFVAIPSALTFLTTFAGDFVSPNLTADSYLGFVMAYVVGLGILFQLPLFLIIWNWVSPLPPGGLLNSQRFVVGFSFVAAAIITPTPDIVNQSLVAGPIIAIYQLGAIAVFTMNRKARRVAQKTSHVKDYVAPQPTRQSTAKIAQSSKLPLKPVPALAKSLSVAAPTQIVAQPKTRPATIDGIVRTPRRTAPSRINVPIARTQPKARPRPRVATSVIPKSPQNGYVPSLMSPSGRAVGLDGFAMYR